MMRVWPVSLVGVSFLSSDLPCGLNVLWRFPPTQSNGRCTEAIAALADQTRRGKLTLQHLMLPLFEPDLFVQVVRGKLPIRVECAPAFNYAMSPHETSIVDDDSIPFTRTDPAQKQHKAVFKSEELTLDLRFIAESLISGVDVPSVELSLLDLSHKGHKGPSVSVDLMLIEGQAVTFVLRTPPGGISPHLDLSAKEAQHLGVTIDSGSRQRTLIHSHIDSDFRISLWRISPSKRGGSLPYQGRSTVTHVVSTLNHLLLFLTGTSSRPLAGN